MAAKPLPPATVLRQLIRYEPDTGLLFWLHRGCEFFPTEGHAKAWNTRMSGKPALNCPTTNGYLHGRIFNSAIMAHRAAWAICHGVEGTQYIDHINGNRSDNRIANLRLATYAENAQNRSAVSSNVSGLRGVGWSERDQLFRAEICSNGRKHFLGNFKNPHDAHCAYLEAKARLHTFNPSLRTP